MLQLAREMTAGSVGRSKYAECSAEAGGHGCFTLVEENVALLSQLRCLFVTLSLAV